MRRTVSLLMAVIFFALLAPLPAFAEPEEPSAAAAALRAPADENQLLLTADVPADDSAGKATDSNIPGDGQTPAAPGGTGGGETDGGAEPSAPGGGETPPPGESFPTGALHAETDGYSIVLSYGPEARIPEGASLSVSEIGEDDPDYEVYMRSAAEQLEGQAARLPYARFFDITILNGDGQAMEPAASVSVQIDLKDGALDAQGIVYSAVHFEDLEENASGTAPTEEQPAASTEEQSSAPAQGQPSARPSVKAAVKHAPAPQRQLETTLLAAETDGVLTFTAESFSVYGVVGYYTVDFYYFGQDPEYYEPVAVGTIWSPQSPDGTPEEGAEEETVYELLPTRPFDHEATEHHISGGGSILLSELLVQLDICVTVQDVRKVAFTDPELLSVRKRSGDYELTSLAPFTSSEKLYLTLSTGEIISVAVRDAVGPSSFGVGLEWLIEDDNTLVIRPSTPGGSGTLPIAPSSWAATPPAFSTLAGIWPWLADAYRSQIEKIRIEDGVSAGEQLRYMFYSCDNLTEVDFSGFDMTDAVIMNDMFGACTGLVDVSLAPGVKSGSLSQISRMFRGCTSLESVDLSGLVGASTISGASNVFQNCPALKKADLSGVRLSSADIFKDAATLEEVDLSGATFDIQNMRNLFHTSDSGDNACTPALKKINMSGATFNTTNVSMFKAFRNLGALEEMDLSNATFPKNVANCAQIFDGCSALTHLNLEGFSPTTATQTTSMFRNCTSLTSIDISDFGTLANCTNVSTMFDGCSALTHLNLEGFSPTAATQTASMFRNCTSLTSIDISDFGTMTALTNVSNMFGGCSALQLLNISNWQTPNVTAGNRDSGIGGLSDLEVLIAENSKVYFVKGGDSASAANSIFPPGDWIANLTGLTGDGWQLPQAELKKLMAGQTATSEKGDSVSNTSGAGFLPAGSYVRARAGQQTIAGFDTLPETFYLIDHLAGATYTMEIDPRDYDVYVETARGSGTYQHWDPAGPAVSIPGDTRVHVYTKPRTRTEWESQGDTYMYAALNPITATYHNAVTDVNGQVHDLRVTFTGFEFHEMRSLSKYGPDTTKSTYADIDENSSRHLLFSADLGKLELHNYIVNDHMLPTVNTNEDGSPWMGSKACATGSRSSTWTDFTLSVPDAEPESTLLFFIEDLDVNYHNDGVPYLYGPGAEGIILRGNSELDTVTMSEDTYLRKYVEDPGSSTGWRMVTGPEDPDWDNANYILGSANSVGGNYDPNCRFYVRAQATRSQYTWTTGTGCNTLLLDANGTAGSLRSLEPLYLTPSALKNMAGLPVQAGDAWDGRFTFDLAYQAAGSTPLVDQLGNPVIPANQTGVSNQASQISFDTMVFSHPRTDPSNNYYIGTYIFEIRENDPGDPLIKYDREKKYLRVVLYNPENDSEMIQGFRAVVTAGTLAPDKTSVDDVVWADVSTTVWSENEQRSYSAAGSGGAIDPNALLMDVYGVRYRNLGSAGYADEMGGALSIDPLSFFPSTSDMVSGGKVTTDPLTGATYPVMADANGTEFYRRDGKYYDTATHAELQAAEPAMVPRTVDSYTVKKDKNGVNYYKNTVDGKYYAEDGTELRAYTGDVDPAEDDEIVVVRRKDDSGVYDLRVDVHGVAYYTTDGTDGEGNPIKIYHRPDGTAFPAENMIFNPTANDKFLQIPWVIDGCTVKEDHLGRQYYRKQTGSDGEGNPVYTYYDTGGSQIEIWSGDVEPNGDDETVESILVKKEPVIEGISGAPVKRDKNRVKYYKVSDKYYRLNGTELTVTPGVFEPDDTGDLPVENEYPVYEYKQAGGTVMRYYRKVDMSDRTGKYYQYQGPNTANDPELALPHSVVDVRSSIDAGEFNNEVSRTDIRINKVTTDNKTGTFKFRVKFTGVYTPSAVFSHKDPDRVSYSEQYNGGPGRTTGDVSRVTEAPYQRTYTAVPGTGVSVDVYDTDGITVIGQRITYQFDDGSGGLITIIIQRTEVDEVVTRTVWLNPADPTDLTASPPVQVAELDFAPGDGKASFVLLDGTSYAFDLSDPDPANQLLTVSDNVWEFTLEENESVVFKQVPLNTVFDVWEYDQQYGWYFVNASNRRYVAPGNEDGAIYKTDAITGDVIKDSRGAPVPVDKVSGKITTADARDYVYTFKNQFTEIAVKKIVTGNLGHRGDVFSFTVTFSGLEPGTEHAYAVEDEKDAGGNTIKFTTAVVDAQGEIRDTFRLQDQETRHIVVPYGADMTVEETLTVAQKARYNRATITIDGKDPTSYFRTALGWVIKREDINPEEDELILVENYASGAIPTEVFFRWYDCLLALPAVVYGVSRRAARRRRRDDDD